MNNNFISLFNLDKMETGYLKEYQGDVYKLYVKGIVAFVIKLDRLFVYKKYTSTGVLEQYETRLLYFNYILYIEKQKLVCVDLDCHQDLVAICTDYGRASLSNANSRGWYIIDEVKFYEHE